MKTSETTIKPHPHAALMRQYAEDAAETDRPWERWERKRNAEWMECVQYDMQFFDGYEYRRKPRIIRIGNFDVPEPIRDRLKYGDLYFTPSILSGFAGFSSVVWSGTAGDDRRLKYGLCHSEQSAAKIHAKALLSLTVAKEPKP